MDTCPICRVEDTAIHVDLGDCLRALKRSRRAVEAALRAVQMRGRKLRRIPARSQTTSKRKGSSKKR